MSLISMKMNLYCSHIFIRIVSYEDSFDKDGEKKIRNGLLGCSASKSYPAFNSPLPIVYWVDRSNLANRDLKN